MVLVMLYSLNSIVNTYQFCNCECLLVVVVVVDGGGHGTESGDAVNSEY